MVITSQLFVPYQALAACSSHSWTLAPPWTLKPGAPAAVRRNGGTVEGGWNGVPGYHIFETNFFRILPRNRENLNDK